jgi:hypothetical protein
VRTTRFVFSLLFLCGALACGDDDAGVDVDAGTDDGGTTEDAMVEGDGFTPDGFVPDPDTGVEEMCDTPGAVESTACGMCGTVERFCNSDRVWVYGDCEGESGVCEAGTTETTMCGNCGTQMSRCSATCEWEDVGTCSDEGECAPGERTRSTEGCPEGSNREVLCSDVCVFEPVEECNSDPCDRPGAIEDVPCGLCGTAERFCSVEGSWEYGTCMDEGVCMPGTTDDIECGMCGSRTARCNDSCAWVPSGACMDEGTCAPGETRRITAGCPSGETRLMECGDGCGYTIELEGCTAARPIDVIFLLETTGSNNGDLTADLPALESACVRPLLALDDVNVGVAYFGEYPIAPYGSSGDRPFVGGVEPGTTVRAVTDEWDGRPMFMGSDGPDALVEGLFSLHGGRLAAASIAMECSAGREAGGCWRPTAQQVVVVHTDSEVHTGPNPDGSGLYSPYAGISPAPATWPGTRTRMRSDETVLLILDDSSFSTTSTQQFDLMIGDLGQPATDRHDISSGTVTDACAEVVARVRGLMP